MSKRDPTDHALAAIASILDQPLFHREPEKPAVEEKPIAPELVEAGGYQKVGPGPIAAIRFKWTVRRDGHNQYYVDEPRRIWSAKTPARYNSIGLDPISLDQSVL